MRVATAIILGVSAIVFVIAAGVYVGLNEAKNMHQQIIKKADGSYTKAVCIRYVKREKLVIIPMKLPIKARWIECAEYQIQ